MQHLLISLQTNFFTSIAQKIADDIVPTDKPPDLIPSSLDDICFNLKAEPLTHSEVYDAINSLQKKENPWHVRFICQFYLQIRPYPFKTPETHIYALF